LPGKTVEKCKKQEKTSWARGGGVYNRLIGCDRNRDTKKRRSTPRGRGRGEEGRRGWDLLSPYICGRLGKKRSEMEKTEHHDGTKDNNRIFITDESSLTAGEPRAIGARHSQEGYANTGDGNTCLTPW